MIGFELERPPKSIVLLGAHPDDIEIGAAGTVMSFAQRYPDATFHSVVLSGNEVRQTEATSSARALLGDRVILHFGGFRDRFLPYQDPSAVKDFLLSAVLPQTADIVFAPHRDDLHQDHRFVAELALQTFRDHPLLGYEILKYDGDLGRPNVFVPLTAEQTQAKIDHLERHFPSQQEKPWYNAEAFRSLMKLRGIEAGAPGGYAEAFYVSKLVLAG